MKQDNSQKNFQELLKKRQELSKKNAKSIKLVSANDSQLKDIIKNFKPISSYK